MKNDPALQVSWSVVVEHHALAARAAPSTASRTSRHRGAVAGLDAERAGQLGVADRRRRGRRAGAGRSRSSTTYRSGSLLEPAGAVAEAAVGGGERALHAVDAGPSSAPRRSCRRPPGRRRRRSGSGWRRRCRGCRTAPRRRPSPRSTARATNASHDLAGGDRDDGAAAGVLRRPSTPRVAIAHDGAVEAGVGDDEVAAARDEQQRRRRPRRRRVRRRAAPARWWRRTSSRGRAAEPQGGVVGQQLRPAQPRSTALGMPSTFSPPQVTSSATCTPSSVTSLTVPRTTTVDAGRRRRARRPAW